MVCKVTAAATSLLQQLEQDLGVTLNPSTDAEVLNGEISLQIMANGIKWNAHMWQAVEY